MQDSIEACFVKAVEDLTHIGILAVFVVVSLSVTIFHSKRLDTPWIFRFPFMPAVPAFGILASGFLMLQPHRGTWLRFVVWRVVGLPIYFHYGCKHRLMNSNNPRQDERLVLQHGETSDFPLVHPKNSAAFPGTPPACCRSLDCKPYETPEVRTLLHCVRCWHAGGVRPILIDPPRTARSWKLLPAVLLSLSGVLLFGVGNDPVGYTLLFLSVLTAVFIDRELARHLGLIAAGLLIISSVPLNADLSTQHMILMGGALALAVLVPWLVSRFVYREKIIKFPVNTGRKWPLSAKLYLLGVVALGYLILPVYLIGTGVYQNWPDASEATIFGRLFLGVNAVGIWDELFFICTIFTLLRRHFPDWLANILQAVIFSSFLWEIGYQAWGPLLTFPFALLQGYTFKLTKSLTYVVSVHLIFDFVLFLVLVHAHNRDWLPIFLY